MMRINQGLLGQIKDSALKIYEDLTVGKIEKFLDEISHAKEKNSNLPPYGHIGNGVYHIGNGVYCNKKGFNEFEDSFYDAIRIAAKEPNVSFSIPSVGLRKLSKIEIAKIKKFHGSK